MPAGNDAESPAIPGLEAPEIVEPPEKKVTASYEDATVRGYSFAPTKVPADYPVQEIFGYPPDADTAAARDARARCWCPFTDSPCAKLISPAKTGICSIRYRAEGFGDTAWAVCEHRLKGEPFRDVMTRHFGARAGGAKLATELRLDQPRMSLDGVGALIEDGEVMDLVGIEAQTIDTRGGSLRPLWEAYTTGHPDHWRDGYPGGAKFGVNTTNVWKRLVPQVMNKGRLYRGWDSKLYVVVQDPVFQFISRRMPLERLPRQAASKAEIVWVLWDYDEGEPRDPKTGMLRSGAAEAVYTTIDQVEHAFVNIAYTPRNEFVRKLLRKLGR